jgi:DNA repair exonuclease SbcCD nuclease subunit
MSQPFTFIHCADLHLDSPFEGLRAVDSQMGARLRDATFQAFDQVINLAVQAGADFIIVAGDVYDGEDRSLRAQLRFRDSLARAVEAGISCYVAHGNHDPLSGWEAGLEMPPGVHRFGGREVERLEVRRGGEILAHLFGISFPIREVKENLAARFPQGDGPFAVGVLHANVGGDPDYDNYAPCTVDDLLRCRMDYWALGHIHTRRILRPERPLIVYPGNTQGRSIHEPGDRGCYLVRVDETGRAGAEFVATDVVRWFSQAVDIAALNTVDDLLSALSGVKDEVRAAAEGRGAILRIELRGRGDLHALLRRLDLDRDLAGLLREGEGERPDFVYVESVQNRTRPPVDLAQRRLVQDFVGDFLNAAADLRQGEDPEATLREFLIKRPESKVMLRRLEQLNQADLQEILRDAETLGLDLLLPEEG